MMKRGKQYFLIGACLLLALVGCGKSEKEGSVETKYVTLGDYKNIAVTVEKSSVTDATIQSYIERMITSYTPEGQTAPTYESLTDEFVATNMKDSGCATVAELKKQVSDYLNSMNEYYATNNTRTAIVEKLGEICTIKKMPEGLLEERVAQYEKIFKSKCKEQYGVEFEEYLSTYQMTEEAFHEQTETNMKKTIESELILLAIGEQEGIKLEEKAYAEFVEQMLENYNYETKEDLYADYGQEYVEDSYICEKVLSMLVESADVTYVAPGSISAE